MLDDLIVIELLEEIDLPVAEREKVSQQRKHFNQTWEQIDKYDISYRARKRKLPHAE